MSIVDDANALAAAASVLATEIEAEESGTVSDKTVTKVTVTYSDGSSVDFSPAGDTAPGVETPAPVVAPVTDTQDATTDPALDTSGGASDGGIDPNANQKPAEVPEGATEVEPTVAGVVPGQS